MNVQPARPVDCCELKPLRFDCRIIGRVWGLRKNGQDEMVVLGA